MFEPGHAASDQSPTVAGNFRWPTRGLFGASPIQPSHRPPPSLSISLSLSPPIEGHHQVDGGNKWEKGEGKREAEERAAGPQWKEGGRPTMKPQLTRRKRAKRIANSQ